ncbi:MAG: hypothetical protein ACRDLT_08560 [Solirubrobacteraceae bacterium]
MAQQPAAGQYGQVQGLFDHGHLVVAHTSVQTGTGIGPSTGTAARLSVDQSIPRRDIAAVGEALVWHGGLTRDHLHQHGTLSCIECNPRTGEPANAAASRVNLPDLQARLTSGKHLRQRPRGRAHCSFSCLAAVPWLAASSEFRGMQGASGALTVGDLCRGLLSPESVAADVFGDARSLPRSTSVMLLSLQRRCLRQVTRAALRSG